jgi:chromosome segregation ATPase
MSNNDGSRFQEVFQHLNRTWEELRLANLDLPLVHDLRQLHEELSAASEHLGNGADLAAFGWKCAKFGAGLQEATIRLFLPAQFQEQLDDLAGEFRINDIRMENRMDDIEQRLRQAPDRPNDDDAVPRLRRRVERLRTEMRELQEMLYAQENEVANLQASVVEIPVLREDVRYLRHELHKLKRPDSPSPSGKKNPVPTEACVGRVHPV